MKKKGFTLIELIVVIAIIGVLAAILVPAMMGYVRKAKITTNNTSAKSIFNAFNTAITDLDSADETGSIPTGGDIPYSGSDFSAVAFAAESGGSGKDSKLTKKVYNYFNDITKVDSIKVRFASNGNPVGVGIKDGRYPGSYPKQMDPDDANNYNSAELALGYACGDKGSGTKK